MDLWEIKRTRKFETKYKRYEKKRHDELQAVMVNLDRYVRALQLGTPIQQIKAGFIHKEPKGIKALDQKGGGRKVKLQETRLYIFPYMDEKTIYLLTIGNKNSQDNDIQFCKKQVEKIKQGSRNGKANDQSIRNRKRNK